ncbi:helix-turn-helix, psq domain-containing protein [Hirsutella rhossiliensis]
MANAIIDVTKNGLSQYRAAQKYDIPQQSISDRLKGQVALADQIQPRQLLKNTVNVDEGGIMSGFGLDSLVGKELQKQWFLTEFGKIADWHYITSHNGWTDNHIAIEWLERWTWKSCNACMDGHMLLNNIRDFGKNKTPGTRRRYAVIARGFEAQEQTLAEHSNRIAKLEEEVARLQRQEEESNSEPEQTEEEVSEVETASVIEVKVAPKPFQSPPDPGEW